MKSLRLSFISLAILVIASLLSACGGVALPSGFPGIASDQTTAYLANNQYVYAVDLSNGTQKWRYPDKGSGNETFFAAPTLTPDGQLIVASYNNKLYSLDLVSKVEKWEFTANDRFVASPLITPQGIFAPSADDHLYALDFAGKLLWSFATQGPNWSTPASGNQCNCLYLASMDHYLYAIDIKSGSQMWKTDLGATSVGTPALGTDNSLYIGTFSSQMISIDAQTGKMRWKTSLQGWVWGGPIVDGTSLYFGDLNGNFYSLQTSDGKIIWQIQSDGRITASPLVTPDAIYFTTEAGSLNAINRNSSAKWSQAVGGKIYTPPFLVNNTILVAPTGTDGVLSAYNANGGQVWPKFVPPK